MPCKCAVNFAWRVVISSSGVPLPSCCSGCLASSFFRRQGALQSLSRIRKVGRPRTLLDSSRPACRRRHRLTRSTLSSFSPRVLQVDAASSTCLSSNIMDADADRAAAASTMDESGANGNGPSPAVTKRDSPERGAADQSTLPPSKRARTTAGAGEAGGKDAGRQRRLFGVLTKTLNKFQEETKKDTAAVGFSRTLSLSLRMAGCWMAKCCWRSCQPCLGRVRLEQEVC